MTLKLDGKPLTLQCDTPGVNSLRKFLDNSPADEVFTTATVTEKAMVSASLLYSRANRALEGYSLVHGRNRYWGNPTAIAALATAVGR